MYRTVQLIIKQRGIICNIHRWRAPVDATHWKCKLNTVGNRESTSNQWQSLFSSSLLRKKTKKKKKEERRKTVFHGDALIRFVKCLISSMISNIVATELQAAARRIGPGRHRELCRIRSSIYRSYRCFLRSRRSDIRTCTRAITQFIGLSASHARKFKSIREYP